MARVLRNEARVELARQHSILVNKRAALLDNLNKEYPLGVPARKFGAVAALTRKIQAYQKKIQAVHAVKGGLVAR